MRGSQLQEVDIFPAACPRHLYKYRAFDKDGFGLRILSHNEVFFASPKALNDPRDCSNPIRYDLLNLNQLYKLNLEKLGEVDPKMSKKKRKSLAMEMARRMKSHPERDKLYAEYVEESREGVANDWGVFSMSAVYNSELMWAHYAESHTGFIVRFNSTSMRRFIEEPSPPIMPMLLWQVEYYDTLPQILPDRKSPEQIYRQMLATKTQVWSYEEEYRLLSQHYVNKPVSLPKDSIDGVILGLRTTDARETQVIEILKARGDRLPLYRVVDRDLKRVVVKY